MAALEELAGTKQLAVDVALAGGLGPERGRAVDAWVGGAFQAHAGGSDGEPLVVPAPLAG